MRRFGTINSKTGEGRKMHGKQAIVVGGSMAGLLATRVLSNHFEQVTLIEHDKINDQPESRKGQPQTRHVHGLLANGLDLLTRYFPDLPDALRAGGAILGDMSLIGERTHLVIRARGQALRVVSARPPTGKAVVMDFWKRDRLRVCRRRACGVGGRGTSCQSRRQS